MKTNKKNGLKIALSALAAVAALLVIASLLIQFVVVPKDPPNISRDYTVVTRDIEGAAGHPDVPDTVEDSGVEYVRDDSAQEPVVETVETRPIYEVIQTFEALPSEQVPMKHEFTINGKTYVLDLVEAEYQAVTRERDELVESIVFEAQTSQPSVDVVTPITYRSSGGQELTVEGKLESLEKTREYWSTYTVKNGTVRIPEGAAGFIYNGKGITYNADDPKWDGWKEDVIQVEGLNPKTVKLTDMRWSGASYHKDGVMYRNLIVTGSRLVSDWTATYIAKGETGTAYNATAMYSGYTDEVGIPEEYATDAEYIANVTVCYSLVSLTGSSQFTRTMAGNRNVLPFVSIAFSIVLLACLILLLLVRRMTGNNGGGEPQYVAAAQTKLYTPHQADKPDDIVIEDKPDCSEEYMRDIQPDESVNPPSNPFDDCDDGQPLN